MTAKIIKKFSVKGSLSKLLTTNCKHKMFQNKTINISINLLEFLIRSWQRSADSCLTSHTYCLGVYLEKTFALCSSNSDCDLAWKLDCALISWYMDHHVKIRVLRWIEVPAMRMKWWVTWSNESNLSPRYAHQEMQLAPLWRQTLCGHL